MMLDDLLMLARQKPDAIEDAVALAQELLKLEDRRATIIDALAALGVHEAAAPQIIEFEAAAGQSDAIGRTDYSGVAVVPGASPAIAQDRRQPAMPSRPTTMGDALEIARKRVMAAQLAEFAAGSRNDEEVASLEAATQSRMSLIEDMARELMAGDGGENRCHCGAPATVTAQGQPYCAAHRPPPLERPALVH